MKADITISELAGLMQVSVHQIRYFEEKGVLLPAFTDTNQYRKYSIDQIYRLSQILLLRKLWMPVQSIKECMTEDNPEQVEQRITHSQTEISREIVRLQQLQQFIGKVLQEHREFQKEHQAYSVKRREALALQKWFELDAEAVLSAGMLAEQKGRMEDLFEADVHYIYDGTGVVTLYTAGKLLENSDRILPAGKYLSYSLQAAGEAELELHIRQFCRHAEREFQAETCPLIVVEKSYLSLFGRDKLHYELLLCVDPAVSEGGTAEA
ncbi:MerR family transcriptional regulator [Paenibacillus sp. FSL R7-0331]|uniref:MerR family transcriptional regulator n=1 Tax=Paenibacillus sp. FSL R7-0331 TaxID=1536773 RepID=UPI0004F6E94B|nr:MerR family transcriptional regulator [Paenibacillus sp. FSL R7-0331]AIQ54139.1 transcriptional regulator [Paenibacillus sp. FSL R7-0331]